MSRTAMRRRRGLATIVTSAIMMSAVCLLGSGGIVWSQSSLNTQQAEMAETVNTYTNKLNESLTYEYVYCSDNPCSTIVVVVTNVGHIGTEVTEIRISDTLSGFNKIHSVSSGEIIPDGSIVISINDPSFSSYSVLDIAAETGRGNIIQTQMST